MATTTSTRRRGRSTPAPSRSAPRTAPKRAVAADTAAPEGGLLGEYATKVWDEIVGAYRADPREDWAKNIELLLKLCPILIPMEELAARTMEPDPRNPGQLKSVARATMYMRVIGERPRTGETQVKAMARALGVPVRVLQAEDPMEVIAYARAHFPEFFLDFDRVADSGGTAAPRVDFVQNRFGCAA